jgi:asparagine synthase (glutamine-hydrolysing)
MCGIAGIFGPSRSRQRLEAMVASQRHRGPDAEGIFESPGGAALLGHNRLSIIDLTPAGQQPMSSGDGRFWIVFNGEIYNYLELRAELCDYRYHSNTDTEVVLAAFERWGEACLDHFIGMFAFLLWDEWEHRLFAARDRFGVKPLNYHFAADGTLLLASEIKALHAAGVPAEPDPLVWSTYFTYGVSDQSERTFWQGIKSVPPGHWLTWQDGRLHLSKWYDLAERSGLDLDTRATEAVEEEYSALLTESVGLRFRSDVPVGINLSGGLDSSTLLGLVQTVQGPDSDIKAFTYVTGDPRYDELPWVRQMLAQTQHPSVVCQLDADAVPDLATSVQTHQGEPFGGLPTLAYARLFEVARANGVIVLLDGQGMDEQWAGYDYYHAAADGTVAGMVQGTTDRPVRPECLTPEFRALAERRQPPQPFPDRLRNLQYRDIVYTKINKALRFNDRISMRSSTELREPFMDHRLFELALRQPPERKILNGTRKALLRKIARRFLPDGIVEAPKRPLQTPQREWLMNSLREWADSCIEEALARYSSSWFDAATVRQVWQHYYEEGGDNSYFIWQWISLGLMASAARLRSEQPQPDSYAVIQSMANSKAIAQDERLPGQARQNISADFGRGPSAADSAERYGVAINYHFVRPRKDGLSVKISASETRERLEEQIAQLSKSFSFCRCSDLADAKANSPGANVLINFDDGLKDVIKYAQPILKRFAVPATLFVCALPYTENRILPVQKIQLLMAYLGLRKFRQAFYAELKRQNPGGVERDGLEYAAGYQFYRYDKEEVRQFKLDLNYGIPYDKLIPVLDVILEKTFGEQREKEIVKSLYLSLDDLKRLVDEGHELGIHGYDHKVLPRLSYEEQRQDIADVAAFLAPIAGRSNLTMAFPYGFADENTRRAMDDAGILAGFGMGRKVITPDRLQRKWDLPRFDVNDCFDRKNNSVNYQVFSSLIRPERARVVEAENISTAVSG